MGNVAVKINNLNSLVIVLGKEGFFIHHKLKIKNKLYLGFFGENIKKHNCINLSVKNQDYEATNSWWYGEYLFKCKKRNINCKVQKYKNIIIYLPNFNELEEGFLKELIVFLKNMNKKVTVISRSKNCTSFANYLNKMCNFINVVDLDDFYTRLYPQISILELEGIANTLVLDKIEMLVS